MFRVDVYCLDGEEWRDIKGYEGIYQASSFGRIRTVDGKKTQSVRHGNRTWVGRVLSGKGSNVKTGPRVSLWKDKKCKDYLVARIVCMAYHGIPDDPEMTVNHKDGNRFNNYIDNLEWLTLADNIRHGFNSGLYPSKRVKLKIGGELHEFGSHAKANRHIGRNHGYIGSCIKGNRKGLSVSGEPIEILGL